MPLSKEEADELDVLLQKDGRDITVHVRDRIAALEKKANEAEESLDFLSHSYPWHGDLQKLPWLYSNLERALQRNTTVAMYLNNRTWNLKLTTPDCSVTAEPNDLLWVENRTTLRTGDAHDYRTRKDLAQRTADRKAD